MIRSMDRSTASENASPGAKSRRSSCSRRGGVLPSGSDEAGAIHLALASAVLAVTVYLLPAAVALPLPAPPGTWLADIPAREADA